MSLFSEAVISFFVNTKEAENALGSLQKKFQGTADSIQNSLIGKLGGIAAGALGIKSISDVYNETLKLVHLSEKWSLPVEKVSQFANMFSLVGGNTEGAIETIDKLQTMANSLRFHSSGPLRELSAVLGTNLYNKDYMGAINALRSRFNELNKNSKIEVLDMMGMDNNAFLRLLKASPKDYEVLSEKALKFGTLNEKSAQSLIRMETALSTIKQSFKAISLSSIEKIVPFIEKISEWLEKIAMAPDEIKSGILGVLGIFTLFGPAVSLLKTLILSPLKGIFSVLNGLKGIFGILKIGFSAIGLKVLAFALIIALVAGGIYLLAKNWDNVTKAVKDYINQSPRLKAALTGIKDLFMGIGKAFELIGKFLHLGGEFGGSLIAALLTGDWENAFKDVSDDAKNLFEEFKESLTPKRNREKSDFPKLKNINIASQIPPIVTPEQIRSSRAIQNIIKQGGDKLTNQSNNNVKNITINASLPNVENGRDFVYQLGPLLINNTNAVKGG